MTQKTNIEESNVNKPTINKVKRLDDSFTAGIMKFVSQKWLEESR